MKKKEIVINRAKWRTGKKGPFATGKGDTQLCNSSKFKCCLGFITIANRVTCGDAIGPAGTLKLVPGLTEEDTITGYGNTELSVEAIDINDDEATTLAQKEKQLKELFKDSPYKLKFIGKPVKYEE
jgi:hypothetical protein